MLVFQVPRSCFLLHCLVVSWSTPIPFPFIYAGSLTLVSYIMALKVSFAFSCFSARSHLFHALFLAISVTQFQGTTIGCDPGQVCTFKSNLIGLVTCSDGAVLLCSAGDQALSLYSMNVNNLAFDCGMLVLPHWISHFCCNADLWHCLCVKAVLVVGFRLVGFLFLWRRSRNKLVVE